MKLFSGLFAGLKRQKKGRWLYQYALRASRHAALYQNGVPDTVDGRFDMLVIHVWLLIRRLNAGQAQNLGQKVFDAMFANMDDSLRELGTSDTAVGKRIKDMAKVFYGRANVYNAALDAGDADALAKALGTNVFTKEASFTDACTCLAAHMLNIEKQLAKQSLDEVLQSGPCYPHLQVDVGRLSSS